MTSSVQVLVVYEHFKVFNKVPPPPPKKKKKSFESIICRKDDCYTRHKIVCTTRFVLCVEKMPSFFDGRACLLKPNAGVLVQDSSEAISALCILIFYVNDCRQNNQRVPNENVSLKIRKFNVYKNEDQTFIAIEAETDVTKNMLVTIKRKDPNATFSPDKLTGIDTVVTFCAEKLQNLNAHEELKILYTGENRNCVDALVQSTSTEKQPMQNRRKSVETTTTTTHIEKTTTMEMCTVVENEVELVPQKKREVGTLCYYYMHAGEEDESNKNLHLTIVRITKVYKDESFGNKSSRYLYDAIAVGYGILEKKIIYFTKEGHPKFFKGKFQRLESDNLKLYTDDVVDIVGCTLTDCLRNLINVTDEKLLRDKVWTPLAKNADEIEHDDVHQLIQTPRKKKQKTKPSNDANEVRVIENTQQYAKNWANDVNENDSDDDDSKSNTAIEKNNIPAGGVLMNQAGNMPSTDLFENASFLDVNSYGNNTTILSLLNDVMTQLSKTKEDLMALTEDSKANKGVQSELQNKLQNLESEIDTLRTENSAKDKELDEMKSQMRMMQENNQVSTHGRGRPTISPTLSTAKKIELVQLVLNLIAEFGLISTQGNKSSVDIDRQSAYFEKGDNDDDDMNVTSHKVSSNFLFMVSASKFFPNVSNGGDNYAVIRTMYTETVGINLTRAIFATLVECSKFACELWSSIQSNSDAAVSAALAAPPAPAAVSAVAGAAAETDRAQETRQCYQCYEIISKYLFPDSKNHEKVFQTACVDTNTWKDQMTAKSVIGPLGFKDPNCYLNLFGISINDERTENGQVQHYYKSVPNKVDHPHLIYLAWLFFKRMNSPSTSVLVAPDYRSLIAQAKPSTYIEQQLEGGTLDRVKEIHAEYLNNTTFYANEFALLIYHLKRIIAVEVDGCKDFIMKIEKRMELFNEAREQVKEYMVEYDAKSEEERMGCLRLIDWEYHNSNSGGVETDANNANSDE